MLRRTLSRSRTAAAVLALVAALAGTAAATTPNDLPIQAAPGLPSPHDFVSNLDLECFRTNPYVPPPVPGGQLTLEHLNPVLAPQAARWTVNGVGQRQQLCTPVAKNGVIPPAEVLEYVKYIDLACYRIGGPTLEIPLVLEHLNPVLSHLPRREVRLMEPQQLCLPVIKNDSVPPSGPLRVLMSIDLVCYREVPQVPMNATLKLTQLNPVLSHLPSTEVGVRENRQLCVPVRKNNQNIPEPILNIVQWIDLEKYDIAAPTLPTVELRLRHVNPLMQGWPSEQALLLSPRQLAVPVAKNGKLPPKL
ncbi:hypothetical protein [Actinophytocola sp.]|uniref:hypothetical protein n=1 Tax=Actinophytocola sp. TaxID=1872138 RepID=UPI002ED16898